VTVTSSACFSSRISFHQSDQLRWEAASGPSSEVFHLMGEERVEPARITAAAVAGPDGLQNPAG
jgi:hypothetical protein